MRKSTVLQILPVIIHIPGENVLSTGALQTRGVSMAGGIVAKLQMKIFPETITQLKLKVKLT